MKETRPPQGAQAALRALRLLKLFTIERPEMSLAEISQRSGLNKTTTHRLLRALQSESLIDRNSVTNGYSLGAGLMALGVQALASSDLRRRVRPLLKTLAQESGETATLEVPVENSMLILDEVTGGHVLATAGNIGTRWPIHATSTGKAWIAFDRFGMDLIADRLESFTARTLTSKEQIEPQISDIRRRGYAITVDELEDGFTAVGTVIRGALGDVEGAVSICGPTQRFSAARLAELGTSLCKAAARLNGRSEYRT
jgi:DNA-binding IclR family transcriptional regulator